VVPNLIHFLLEQGGGSLCEPLSARYALTLLSPAAEVPAKADSVAPGAAARSPGHGGPWGQVGIAAQLLYLTQLKDLLSSLLKPRQTVRREVGRVYLGQPQTSIVQFQRA